jgi:transposase
MTTAVVASATTLTDLYGVGPIIAAIVIGYSGDVHRFPTAAHYAAHKRDRADRVQFRRPHRAPAAHDAGTAPSTTRCT